MPILGTPYERGNSDVIVSRAYAASLGEGLAVSETEVNGVLTMNVGASPIGVSGRMGLVAGDEIKSGLKVYVQAETEDEEITIGSQVYVVAATGKFTQTKGSGPENVPLNATARTKIVDCIDSKGNKIKGFAIDFPNGL
uniref:Uncharacterized protein n=1 Tax=Dulem virus 29 TaxID=3145747 RepID=A0AAU8B1T0_9CAUD